MIEGERKSVFDGAPQFCEFGAWDDRLLYLRSIYRAAEDTGGPAGLDPACTSKGTLCGDGGTSSGQQELLDLKKAAGVSVAVTVVLGELLGEEVLVGVRQSSCASSVDTFERNSSCV